MTEKVTPLDLARDLKLTDEPVVLYDWKKQGRFSDHALPCDLATKCGTAPGGNSRFDVTDD